MAGSRELRQWRFPRQARPSEVAVVGGTPEDWTQEIQPLDDGPRSEVEAFLHEGRGGAHLDSLQRDERHVDGTLRYLQTVAAALGWTTLGCLNAHALAAHLSEESERRGTGPRTFNAAVTAWRAFGSWCVRAGRLSANPMASVGTRNSDADRRRVRRDVTPDELARIIDAATRTPAVVIRKSLRNAKGELRTTKARLLCPERAWAYRIAAGTGFRAGEVASLTPESFDLDADTPSVTVEAGYSKRRRRDVQPIRPDLAAMLRPWLATKAPGEQLNLLPDGRAGQVLAADMDAARAAWIAEARTPGERAEREASDFLRHTDAAGREVDFHGLRVHYISRVVEAGANVKEAMGLARHSDPKLTLRTYAKVSMHNLARVLDGMPNANTTPTSERQTLRATGTDDATSGMDRGPKHGPQKGPHSGPHSQHDSVRVSAASRDGHYDAPAGGADRKPLQIAGLDDEAQRGAASCENAPRRTRTFDPLIKSRPDDRQPLSGNEA